VPFDSSLSHPARLYINHINTSSLCLLRTGNTFTAHNPAIDKFSLFVLRALVFLSLKRERLFALTTTRESRSIVKYSFEFDPRTPALEITAFINRHLGIDNRKIRLYLNLFSKKLTLVWQNSGRYSPNPTPWKGIQRWFRGAFCSTINLINRVLLCAPSQGILIELVQ